MNRIVRTDEGAVVVSGGRDGWFVVGLPLLIEKHGGRWSARGLTDEASLELELRDWPVTKSLEENCLWVAGSLCERTPRGFCVPTVDTQEAFGATQRERQARANLLDALSPTTQEGGS